MKPLDNTNLTSLKCVLFCFLSGVGSIFPFLALHMQSVGLNIGEARLISAVAPCIALLGPAALGLLIDRLSVGRGSTGGSNDPSGSGRLLRIITALCLILSALFYTLLLAVPYTERHTARRPEVRFMCDANGAYVMQEVCEEGMRCNRWSGDKSGVLAVQACEYGCSDPNMTWVREPFDIPLEKSAQLPMYNSFAPSAQPNSIANSTEPSTDIDVQGADEEPSESESNPPHLCYNGQCQVYMQHAPRMRVPLTLIAPDPVANDTEEHPWCMYRTGPLFHCLVPQSRLDELEIQLGCTPAVRCQVVDPYDEPDGVLADAECRKIVGDPSLTFWSYLVIRILADIWPISALALLGAACVIATRETSLGRGDVGRQLAIGTLGLAIFPPLAGLAAQEMPENRFLVPFILHAVFMIIGALILIFDNKMPLSAPEWWWHTSTGVLTMPMNVVRRYGAETAAVFAVVTLLGILWSGIDTYLPWTIENIGGMPVDVGLTLTCILPAVPVLWFAEAIVDYIGHSNIFITAFIFYCIRYTALAYTTTFAWIVVAEVLQVITLSLVWVTAMLYFRHLVPRKYTTTGQALPVIAHFCIGRCIGAIVSGMVSSFDSYIESTRDVYRALGVVSLIVATVYLALYHMLLAPRCAAPAQSPPQHLLEGLNTNGGTNGYSPMRVYHEERSRKGHFRY